MSDDIQIEDEDYSQNPNAQYEVAEDGGLYVDFSGQEADSEARDYEPLPTGKYLATITNVELRESQSMENPGKPMYGFEFTVVDGIRGGEFNGRKAWTNACLWSGALYTVTHIMKATGFPVSQGRMRIPSAEEFMGKQLVIGGKNAPSKNKKTGEVYEARYEPRYFAPEGQWDIIKAGGNPSSGGVVRAKASSSSAHLLQ
jgi:uncharacterized protein DUF669